MLLLQRRDTIKWQAALDMSPVYHQFVPMLKGPGLYQAAGGSR